MVKDNLSDFLAQLKNASRAKKSQVLFPYSKLVAAVAELLKQEGYLVSVERKGKKMGKFIEAMLAYDETKQPRITDLHRISKPSRRVYAKSKKLYPVLNGLGRSVLSTPQGLMTDRQARRKRIGGELLFKIW